jgi:amidase
VTVGGFPADLERVTVAELRRGLDESDFTAVALVEACIARIAALNNRGPGLRAVRAVAGDAVDQARRADDARRQGLGGPLLGIPVLIKDNVDVAGMTTTAGSVALQGLMPSTDAVLVGNLRAAGAIILGKVNLTEFANFMSDHMPSGYSSLVGQVLNPYDVSLTPSGSSSGAPCAVVSGMAPLAVGTETSGSVLAPAEAQSAVGIKPTVGLVSRTGVVPISTTQDTAGAIARCVADAAALLAAMAGADPQDPATDEVERPVPIDPAALDAGALRGARLGAVTSFDDSMPDPVRRMWTAARRALEGAGAELVPVRLPPPTGDYTVLVYEMGPALDAYLAGHPGGGQPSGNEGWHGRGGQRQPQGPGGLPAARTLAEIVAYNEAHAAECLKFGQVRLTASRDTDHQGERDRYEAARAHDLAETRDRIDALVAEHRLAALVYPGVEGYDTGARAGYPSVTVPAGYRSDGRRPFGIQLLGPAWSEPRLLDLAYAFERVVDGHQPPSVVNPTILRGSGLEQAAGATAVTIP